MHARRSGRAWSNECDLRHHTASGVWPEAVRRRWRCSAWLVCQQACVAQQPVPAIVNSITSARPRCTGYHTASTLRILLSTMTQLVQLMTSPAVQKKRGLGETRRASFSARVIASWVIDTHDTSILTHTRKARFEPFPLHTAKSFVPHSLHRRQHAAFNHSIHSIGMCMTVFINSTQSAVFPPGEFGG